MGGIGVALLKTTAANVLQGDFLILVFVRLLLRAAVLLVESDADIHTFHK